MSHFRTTAVNAMGYRFLVRFSCTGWPSQVDAQRAVDRVVASDPLHLKHGPFIATQIDITS